MYQCDCSMEPFSTILRSIELAPGQSSCSRFTLFFQAPKGEEKCYLRVKWPPVLPGKISNEGFIIQQFRNRQKIFNQCHQSIHFIHTIFNKYGNISSQDNDVNSVKPNQVSLISLETTFLTYDKKLV